MFKLFDRECKLIDYRLAKLNELNEGETDQELEEALEKIVNKKDAIERYKESLAVCTENYYKQLVEITDEDEAKEVTSMFTTHCEKVEAGLNKMVCYQ